MHNRVPDINIPDYVYNQSGLDYSIDTTVITPNTITSDPVKVCFCFDGYPDCSHLDPVSRNVKKGEAFVVSLIAVDQVGHPVTAAVQSSLMFTQSGLAELRPAASRSD